MPLPKTRKPLRKAASSNSGPGTNFFDQYVWHHKVHEHLKECVRYFLLALSPYDEDKLKNSLRKLVEENHISGLRAYRVFGRDDLLIRAWMHNDTFGNMEALFYKYIAIGSVRIERVVADYITRVEHRWYWETPSSAEETSPAREEARRELMSSLSHELAAEIESGRNRDALLRHEREGLILRKPATEKTITFFICVKLSDDPIKNSDRERLLRAIEDFIAARKSAYRFAEIDRASGVICSLIIRARAQDYFAIGKLAAWLSTQPHVSSTETYLSLLPLPLTGDTKLSVATFDALDVPDRKVQSIFPDPYYPNGPYPKRRWGVVANDVVVHLVGSNHGVYARGLKTFLRNYLLGVLNKNPAQMGAAIMYVFGPLEGYLNARKGEYIHQQGLTLDAVFDECFPPTGDPKKQRSRDTLGFAELLLIYYKTAEKTAQGLRSPSSWNDCSEVRNWGAHGKGYRWEDARLVWKKHCDTMINFWHDLEALYREVRRTCKSRDEGLPDVFPDD